MCIFIYIYSYIICITLPKLLSGISSPSPPRHSLGLVAEAEDHRTHGVLQQGIAELDDRQEDLRWKKKTLGWPWHFWKDVYNIYVL